MGIFRVQYSKTGRMPPSEIIRNLYGGSLRICPDPSLGQSGLDHILSGFLYRLTDPEADQKPVPRCLILTDIGTSCVGLPAASFQIAGPDGIRYHSASPCTYCEHLGCCKYQSDIGYFAELLESDPIYNAPDLTDEDEED